MTEPLLTAKEAAALLRVHVNTVKRMIRNGQLPVYRFGERGDIRISPKDIETWLKERRVEASNDQ